MSNCKPNFSTLTVLLTAIASLGVGCADEMEGDPSISSEIGRAHV